MRRIRKISAWLMVFSICFVLLAQARASGEGMESFAAAEKSGSAFSRYTYEMYISDNGDVPKGAGEISIAPDSYVEATGPVETDEEKGITWAEEFTDIVYEVTVDRDSKYAIYLEYNATAENTMFAEMAVLINDELPFDGADKFMLRVPWVMDLEFRSDSRGNHLMPAQRADTAPVSAPLADSEGLYNKPYEFVFRAGTNRLTIRAYSKGIRISKITLKSPAESIWYAEYENAHKGKQDKAADKEIYIDAEKPLRKSDSSITPLYERGSAATEPNDPVKMLLNTIGGDKWQLPGQWIEYSFDVPETGYYRLNLRCKQNLKNGLPTIRRMYIDGEVPFEEAESLAVPFSIRWQMLTAGGKDQPYWFYLEKGTHTLRFEVATGKYGEIARNVLEAVYDLNALYREIIMITGTSPDIYRDYDLVKSVPGLMDVLESSRKRLQAELDTMVAAGEKGSETAVIEDLLVQIRDFQKKPDTIPKALEFFRSNISAVSSWVLNLNRQPLEIDYIVFQGRDVPDRKAGGSFFSSLWYQIASILGSFVHDYNVIGDVYDKNDSLNVWVFSGRDQAQTIKQLIDEQFTSQYRINVNVSLVQTGLIEATLAKNGPDIALFAGSGDPVNLASRGALVELSQFDSFEEVSKRFYPSAMEPYKYNGGVYALPLTQHFPMLFYRSDIFAELGIEPPRTWDDLYKLINIIQGRNMNIGMPDIFATLLYQNGGRYYNDDLSATEFDTPAASNAFTQWTEFYSMYGLPLTYDLYNRFRTGEMPLAIADYTFYTQLYVAAPEIRNLWEMTLVPGTVLEDGTINNTVVGGGGQAAIIMHTCKNKEAAWTFLDWFTSDKAQADYGNLIEARLGVIGRYPTANKEAFKLLPTSVKLKNIIIEQWERVEELPQIPASYYVSRNLTNAFRRVQYYYENPRHTLHIYNRYINEEIKRKREEMGRYALSQRKGD